MRTLALLIPVMVIGRVAAGQTEQKWVPIDQAVGDLDHLSTGLRRVEAGLRLDGQQTSLFRLDPPWSDPATPSSQAERSDVGPTYYRLGPGLQARVDRIDYLIPTGRRSYAFNIQPAIDGQYIELISANTVFELNPRLNQTLQPIYPLQDKRIDLRVRARVDARIYDLSDNEHTAAAQALYPQTTHTEIHWMQDNSPDEADTDRPR